jgi:CRP/FNR family cyclic AMP-dependent transcriptional regulator
LRKDSKIELIKRAPLFEHCTARELSRIASVANEYNYPAGATLAGQGTRGNEFMVTVDGAVAVTRNARKVNTLGAGDFFGEVSLLIGREHTATVTTTEASTLLVINGRPFRRLLRDVPSLQLKVVDALAARVPAD